jgi:hypothetical protein
MVDEENTIGALGLGNLGVAERLWKSFHVHNRQ